MHAVREQVLPSEQRAVEIDGGSPVLRAISRIRGMICSRTTQSLLPLIT
ncbi:MAG TPA: hypothetical protein VN604_03905 [Nitrospirota bacterium]|nr:hypothetical protein [Nitrospirota bacterium]